MIKDSVGMDLPSAAVDDLQDFVSKLIVNSADIKKAYISHGNKCRQKIDHDHEMHRQTIESTKLLQENKFSKIMHRRVNPAPTLRKQHPPVIRSNSVRIGVPNNCVLKRGKCLRRSVVR